MSWAAELVEPGAPDHERAGRARRQESRGRWEPEAEQISELAV
jgi:hypothetical protein